VCDTKSRSTPASIAPWAIRLREQVHLACPTACRAGCDLALSAGISTGQRSPRRGRDFGRLDGKAILTHDTDAKACDARSATRLLRLSESSRQVSSEGTGPSIGGMQGYA
jgi:hypothetical protein